MAKIEQDNRVLAELDKTRATVGGKLKKKKKFLKTIETHLNKQVDFKKILHE